VLLRKSFSTQNILNPSNKIQCDDCKRDITKATKIMVEEGDYCCSCFANLEEYPAEYRVINKLDFPLYDHEWTAEEELLLFEGLEKYSTPYAGTASATGAISLI
jgi:hypothetical protein